MANLQEEFDYYLEHQDEFVNQYDGRYIVIKDNEVIGDYDDIAVAVKETAKKHQLGTFLVQLVTEGDEAYTATFRSRVRL
ncbi:MAG: DUF5678 domain-containing protein [Gammaproteobacteria bacterium]|nr:DUF5678 domain-containing protein [Gammaproteobacteria bacterium]